MGSRTTEFALQLVVRLIAAAIAIAVVWLLTRNLIWTLLFAFLGAEIVGIVAGAFVVPWLVKKTERGGSPAAGSSGRIETQELNSATKAD